MSASELFVLALVVMCIAVVALAAVQSRHEAKAEPKETMPIDREDQASASPDAEDDASRTVVLNVLYTSSVLVHKRMNERLPEWT